MNGKPPKFTSPWKTTPSPQFDAKPIYRKEFAPPFPSYSLGVLLVFYWGSSLICRKRLDDEWGVFWYPGSAQ
jgi:hypothetical protein